jgi:luciferase family oxidoreductase group 1
MLPNHSPLIVAEQFATLALLYPGRIDLGLGRAPGTDQLTASAIRTDRMTSVMNFPEEINQILKYMSPRNSDAKVRVPFAEGVDVPVYILGSSTDSAHLAASMGLPYAIASHFATTHLMEAINIYRNNFKPSSHLKQPYVIAAANVIVCESNNEAERELTTLIKMFYGVLTGNPGYLQPAEELSPLLKEVWKHPQVQQMLQYTFYGDADTVKDHTIDFLKKTLADELIIVSNQFSHAARLRSFEGFAAIMKKINQQS